MAKGKELLTSFCIIYNAKTNVRKVVKMTNFYQVKDFCPSGSFPYAIKAGDTLYNLAQEFNTSVEAIMELNPRLNPYNLQTGQIICIPAETPAKCPANSFEYTIKSGDTLYNLAKRYDTSVEEILAINPNLNPYNLQVGQKICIPSKAPAKCPANSFEYTIKAGDTLYNLANQYNTSVEEILAINPSLNPYNLQIGQMICIPYTMEPGCDGWYYVVKKGDSLYTISNKYEVSVKDLMAANPGVDPYNLQVGQLICIPKGEADKPCPGGTIYEVRHKDTLASILLKFNISVMDLKEGNPNLDIDHMKAGQKICILPHQDRGCPCPSGTNPYIIVEEDKKKDQPVVAVLAKKFKTSVENIMKVNPNLAPGDFKVGKIVCIPAI